MARPRGQTVVLPPNTLERDYRRAMFRWLRQLAALLDEAVARQLTVIGDEIDDRARADALRDNIRALVATIGQVRLQWGRMRTTAEVIELARRTGNNLAGFNARRIARWYKSVTGVDPVLNDALLKFPLSAFEQANLSLITKMEERLVDQTQNEIIAALREGRRANELSAIIQDRLGVAESRAKLIARDQLNKLNGQLNSIRQRQLGITRFIWQTVEDERVRPEHEALNGQVFTWEQGAPGEGLPGEPISCRCYGAPVLEDVLGPET